MKNIRVIILILTVFGVVNPVSVRAAYGINRTINFSGKLVNASGVNVPNSTPVTVTFSLYEINSSCPGGGTAVWSENQTFTPVDGIFRVALGSQTAFGSSIDFSQDTLYLGIKVSTETNEMCSGSSRIKLAAVPYAFNAEKFAGLTADNNQTNYFTITGGQGTTSTLNVAGNITVGSTITPTTAGGLTVQSNGAYDLTLDSGTTGSILIGTGANAKTMTIGNALADLSFVDTQWGITGAGAASLTSIIVGGDTINEFAGNGLTVSSNALTVDTTVSGNGLSSTTSSGSGLETLSSGVTLLQGCAQGDVLMWDETNDVWECAATEAPLKNVLGAAYNNSTASFTTITDGDDDDDQDITFETNVSETWIFEAVVYLTSPAQADGLFQVTAPTGAVCKIGFENSEDAASESNVGCGVSSGQISTDGAYNVYRINGTVVTDGTNSGKVSVQFAQNSSTGTSTIASGSYILATRVSGSGGGSSSEEITLTGDVTGSGAGTIATTLGADRVLTGNIQDGTITGSDLATNITISTTGTINSLVINGATQTLSAHSILDSGALTVSSGVGGILTLTSANNGAGTAGNVVIDVGSSSAGNGTILIGTAARTQTITIGNSTGGVITIGAVTGSDLVLQDAQWGVTGAGAGSFASVTTTGSVAVNSASGIASDQTTLIVNAAGTVNIQDNLDVNGTIQTGSSNVTLTLVTGMIDADAITLASAGTTGGSSSRSGLETNTDGLTLLMGCTDNQVLKWTDASGWSCADDDSSAGAGITTVQVGDSTVTGAANVLDFLAADFDVIESPGGEANVSIDYASSGITRAGSDQTVSGNWTFSNGLRMTDGGTFALSDGTNNMIQVKDQGTYSFLNLSAKTTTSDPTSCAEGDVYYNSNDDTVKICHTGNTWESLDNNADWITVKRKTANETLTSSDVVQSDDHLTFSVLPSENWIYRFEMIVAAAGTTPDIKFDISTPTAPTYCRFQIDDAEAGNSFSNNTCNGTGVGGTVVTAAADTFYVSGSVDNGSTGGTVALQWAQNGSSTQTLTVYRGSFMEAFKVQGADLAEFYNTDDPTVMPGDVVSLDPTKTAGVKKTQFAYDTNTIGVVSTKPGLAIGDQANNTSGKPVPVALAGRVPVKVTTENGNILPGDYLTTSSTPGVAMKATKSGVVLGQALTSFAGPSEEIGMVLGFIKNTYSLGVRQAEADQSDFGLLNLLVYSKDVIKKENLSEITTDRLIAGLEIITPTLKVGEIFADKINVKQIEGWEGLMASVSARQQILGQASDSAIITIMPTPTEQALDYTVFGDLVANNAVTVYGQATFLDRVDFKSLVSFEKGPVFDKDTVGFAKIQQGSDRVDIVFDNEYSDLPVVTVNMNYQIINNDGGGVDEEANVELEKSVLGENYGHIITRKTRKGFTIILNKKATRDVDLSWTAFAVKDSRIFSSVVPTGIQVTPVPASTSVQLVDVVPATDSALSVD